ncbi:hypothetical protein QNH38_08370 [Paenibacillus polymyxa]|uniref:hypothetical protein n=1 Tax=Paenibacillus polymyxa TaxID=1406 RepID=UPI000ED75517|nr:hypothetical protein [Paenibacillus polymyxa]RGL32318.1 hypothetical protein DXC69_18025 [Paenibacillus polymyxa]WHX37446.1 hypothetical protein QNH38_08370 [Paenibacillus polymyxa]
MMIDEWREGYIQSETARYLTNISEENKEYYKKHTELVNDLKSDLPEYCVNKLLELEESFNEQLLLRTESYRMGLTKAFSVLANTK